jgi:rhodanese-related sulfurtransferase
MDNELFVDVRTDEEWDDGHLDGALHFELARLEQGELPDLKKDAPIALYCRRGIRAGQALRILKKNGFMKIRNAGGYDDLKR